MSDCTPVNTLLQLLRGVKPRGDGKSWDALCPAHDDARQSLSVGLADGGRVLVHCHRGCPTEDVLAAVGLTLADLFPESRNGAPRVAATYSYRDEAGVLLYQTVRYEPKDFRQRRPKVRPPRDDRPDDWHWNLQGVPRVLYRLPEVLAADPSAPVFVAEGEKDADRLASLGLVSTTNVGGAGKWRSDYNAPLKGRRVVVLPDNDQPGRDHAESVVNALRGVARAARVLALPGLPEKGDVSDWLNAGGTAQQLLALAAGDEAPPEVTAGDVATIEDLIRAGSQVSWVWPGWIQLGVLNAVAAPGGTGKTRFCADLLRRVRHGLPWPDGKAIDLPRDALALWVLADNHHDEMVTLALDFDIAPNVRINATRADPYGGVTLETADDYRDLEARIGAVRPAFVIIDTVGNATDRNLSRQEDAKAFYQPLQVLARRYRCAILPLTHLNATGHFLGRRVLEKCRVAIRMDQYEGEERRRLHVHKTNSKRPADLGVTLGDHGNDYDDAPPEPPSLDPGKFGPSPAVQKAIEWIRRRLAGASMRLSYLIEEAKKAGIDKSAIFRAKAFIAISEDEKEGKKWWTLPSNDSE